MKSTTSFNCFSIIFSTFIAVFLHLPGSADAAQAQSRKQFCSERNEPGYFNKFAYQAQNHMAFNNHGGLFNMGVCWWHALYQRAAWYLTVYRPELPKPTRKHAEFLVHEIAAGKRIVEIPGYSSFFDFSQEWSSLIQAKLEEWQLVDGFLKFAWIEGLNGNHVVPPSELAKEIDQIYHSTVVESDVQWVMLQFPGISSHGILSIDVVRHPAGAQMEIVDNNFVGQIKVMLYAKQQGSLKTIYGDTVPYLGRKKDLVHFRNAANIYCSHNTTDLGAQNKTERHPLHNEID